VDDDAELLDFGGNYLILQGIGDFDINIMKLKANNVYVEIANGDVQFNLLEISANSAIGTQDGSVILQVERPINIR
jgi:hypothetical protein